MNDFVVMAISRFGMPMSTARTLIGHLLARLTRDATATELAALRRAIPDLDMLVDRAMGDVSLDRHLGALDAEPELSEVFDAAGLDETRAAAFARMLLDYLSGRIGGEMVSAVTRAAPSISSMIT